MPLSFLQFLYDLGLYLFIALWCIYLLILCVHFTMPKSLLETYFKPPYFKPAEIAIFSSFPMGYIRTVMFMRVLGYPASGAKRGLTEAHQLVPSWFCALSKITILAFAVTFLGFCLILLIFIIEMSLFDH